MCDCAVTPPEGLGQMEVGVSQRESAPSSDRWLRSEAPDLMSPISVL